jgi:two-component system LytT family response regulator
MRIRTLFGDGDRFSRQVFHSAIIADPEIGLVAECDTSDQVMAAISKHQPSLLFLDVQMRDLNCLELVKALGTKALLATIFIVPPGKYPMTEFDLHSFTYLVRPISESRLSTVLADAKAYIKGQYLQGTGRNVSSGKHFSPNQDRLVIKAEGRVIFVRVEEIDWIQANGNYVRVHVGKTSYLHRQTIGGLQEQLDPARFLRIHRSAIVNIDQIRELRPWPTGEYVVLLRNGKELTLSRGYRARSRFLSNRAGVPGEYEKELSAAMDEALSRASVVNSQSWEP